MTQVCECASCSTHTRRLSAEEFCALSRREAGSLYRPRSEVLRMLAVGEAWGVCTARDVPLAALLALPLNADAAAAAALREIVGRSVLARRGWFLTPPVSGTEEDVARLLAAALGQAGRRAHGGPVWAALECTPEAEGRIGTYFRQGLALRAMRPLDGLAPYYLFAAAEKPAKDDPVWVPLADAAHLAMLLSRGWAAVDSRMLNCGLAVALCPV